MFGSRSQGKVYNFVHADEIWKDHVIREIQSQKRWSEQWGYLLEEYETLQEGLLDIGEEFKNEQELVKELAKRDAVKEVIVQTTDEVAVGKGDKIVDVLGMHLQNNARGKNDIVKLLNWPREGLE